MSLRNLEFAITESLTGITRNGLMSVASITTVALSLAILGAFALLALGINTAVQTQLDKFEIAVWLSPQVTEDNIKEVNNKIESFPHVSSVQFVASEETWEKIKNEWGAQIELSGVEPDTLTHHFRVKLEHPRHSMEVSQSIEQLSSVSEVIAGGNVVDQVVRFADLVKLIGSIAAGVLFVIAGFIVSNTIRLTLYARRNEIRIMQLVGATNSFIRLPYIFEGMILGLIGGGIACGIVAGISGYVAHAATQVMPLLGQIQSGVDQSLYFAGLVLLGCIVGMAGSMISIRRFLRTA